MTSNLDQQLHDAIHEYANWWIKQPSDSEYDRHFDTDGKNYLLLWEGLKEGYGFDYYDYNNYFFYRNCVFGTNGLISFLVKGNKIGASLGMQDLGDYESVPSLRTAMLNDWKNLRLNNPQQQKDKVKEEAELVINALKKLGEAWQASDYLGKFITPATSRHFAVNHQKAKFYLALWLGNTDDVWFNLPNTKMGVYDYDGRPVIKPNASLHYAGLEAGITGDTPAYYLNRMQGRSFFGLGTYNNLQDLLEAIEQALSRLKFSKPNERWYY